MKRKYSNGHPRKSSAQTERTTFGLAMKSLRGNDTLKQMADAIGCSEGYLSEIEHGKRPPELDLIVMAIVRYKPNKEDTVKLFEKAFASSDEVVLNTKYFQEKEKREQFAKMFTMLLLLPYAENSNPLKSYSLNIAEFSRFVKDLYRSMLPRISIDLAKIVGEKQLEKTENGN